MKLYPYPSICVNFLDDNYYNEKYLIQTRSQAETSGIKLPEVHGMGKI